jgi:hypothetical protein
MNRLKAKYVYALFLPLTLFVLLIPATKLVHSYSKPSLNSKVDKPATSPQLNDVNLPLVFEANQGQSDSRVRFLSRNRGYNLFLTQREAVLSLTPQQTNSSSKAASSVIKIKPEGANPLAVIEGQDLLETKSNYLVGHDSNQWHTDIANYARVAYRSLYPGIDLLYYGNDRQLEYDFRLSPQADASQIRLNIQGAKSIRIDRNGDLLIDTPAGLLRQLAPQSYQDVDGRRQEVQSRYVLIDKQQVGFALGEYDHNQPLVIDPVLNYSRLIGGTGVYGEWGKAIAVDSSGNMYVTGETASANFPVTAGAFQTTHGGGEGSIPYDVYVAKINPSGGGVVYATYIGGASNDVSKSIVVDAAGHAYVAGETNSTNFPVTAGAYQTTRRGGWDAFVTKLNASGSALNFSTYLGGTSHESEYGLAVDATGNIYLAGRTASANFPIAVGAFQPARNTEFNNPESYDGFVTKLNPTASALIYSTYLGGSRDEYLWGLAVGSDGSAYVTGSTYAANFPTTAGAYQSVKAAPNDNFDDDIFVTRLNPSGSSLLYSTFIGSVGSERSSAIALDASGNAFITGLTSSATYPTTAGAYQTVYPGAPLSTTKCVVTKLNATGTALVYSTFLGGANGDEGSGITVDATGNAVVVGSSDSPGFPTTADAFQRQKNDKRDGFLARFNATGSQLLYSTFFGDNDFDRVMAVVVDGQSTAYFTGATTSSQFPVTEGSSWNLGGSNHSDVFVAKLSFNQSGFSISGQVTNDLGNPLINVPVIVTGSLTHTVYTDETGHYSINNLQGGGRFTVEASRPGATFTPSSQTISNISQNEVVNFSGPSPLFISGRITDSNGIGLFTQVNLAGPTTTSTYTNGDGYYAFGYLPAGGSYTVTPDNFLYSFAPASSSVANLDGDKVFNFTGTPPPNISGRITDENGYSVSNVTVTLTGTYTRYATTDYNGQYLFYNVQRGGNYTATPSYYPNMTFSPASQSIQNITSDQTFNFTLLFPLMLNGRITDSYGSGIPNVQVALTGTTSTTVYTGYDGSYTFFDLPRGGSFTVTPTHAFYDFTPASATVNDMQASTTKDFTAAPKQFTISGQVATAFGTLSGVTVTLSGVSSATTQTDSNGNYSFTGLIVGGYYTITPSKLGYSFTPASRDFPGLSENSTANFQAQFNGLTISGHLSEGTTALSGVSVALSVDGLSGGSVQTDANGNYSFTMLQPGATYTITPTLTHYSFTPASRDFPNLSANETADFSGTRLTHTIGGRVTDSANAGQGGVTVTLTGGQSASTQTNASGNYSFAGLPAGANYAVTPSKTHYSFSPASRSFDNLSANQSGDFTATLLRYDISGRVVDAGGNSLAGVNVALGGAQSGSTTTDANGNFVFASLPAGGNYTITPAKQFYVFNPASQSFNNLSGSQTANFTGTLLTYSITGRVTEGSAGVAGVTIALGGSQSGSLQTDAAGYYTFTGLPAGGNYTITPSHPFFTFLPVFNSFTSLSQNQNANFNAVRLTYQVSGLVRNVCLQAIAGVTLTLSHDGINVTAQTNASGAYQFNGVPAGFNYSLTPSLSGYSFNPFSATFPGLTANQTANFTGTPPPSTSTVQMTADAYVRAGSNAGNNFGTSTQLIDRLASSANNTYETYVTFDVGQLCTVANVKLRLFGKLSSNGNLPVAAYAVSNTSWTETGITWNNKPATGAQLTTTTITSTANAWYEWNITSYVQSELAAGRRIISIALKGTSVTNNDATFNSRQAASNKPEVSITNP